jgi:hypothetical protein
LNHFLSKLVALRRSELNVALWKCRLSSRCVSQGPFSDLLADTVDVFGDDRRGGACRHGTAAGQDVDATFLAQSLCDTCRDARAVWGRDMGWIATLRWLLLVPAGVGAALAYIGWSDSATVRHVETNGVEATARVHAATRTGRRGDSVANFTLKLSWHDRKGRERIADGVWVSDTFARPHFSGLFFTPRTERIKYLPETDSAPIVLADVGHRMEVDERILTTGGWLAGGGVGGFLLMLLLGRRWRGAPAQA